MLVWIQNLPFCMVWTGWPFYSVLFQTEETRIVPIIANLSLAPEIIFIFCLAPPTPREFLKIGNSRHFRHFRATLVFWPIFFLVQVLRLIEASEAVLEEKQWQQFAASGSCTLSTNEKPRSIAHKCSRPISYRTKIEGGGTEIPVFRRSPLQDLPTGW